MSSGGVFNIVSSTSSMDRLIFAQDFLVKRINEIVKQRGNIPDAVLTNLPQNDPYVDIDSSVLPSLVEIEKSHTVFVNGLYKPCIQLVTDYVKAGIANPAFGSKIIINIPKAGDFISQPVLHIKLGRLSALDTRDRVRYVAMLGHRLIKEVKMLTNNGSVIDSYTHDEMNSYYQMELKRGKQLGYLRGIGQQLPQAGNLVSDPLVDQFSQVQYIYNGLQTYKFSHNAVDLFIPLIFWFKDLRNAIPALPWGSLQLSVEFSNVIDIVASLDNGGGGLYTEPKIESCDLYTNQLSTTPEILSIFLKKYVFGIIRLHKTQKQAISTTERIHLNMLKFPIEYITIAFRPRENLTMSQDWYKNTKLIPMQYQVPVIAKNPSQVLHIMAISSTNNTVTVDTSTLASVQQNYYRGYNLVLNGGTGFDYTDLNNNMYMISGYTGGVFTITGNWRGHQPDATTTFELYTPTLAINSVTYNREVPVVDTIGLSAQGVDIYSDTAAKFYRDHLGNIYDNIHSPYDGGMYLMSFCQTPLEHNPSGSLDFSVLRECYLEFTSTLINKDFPVDVLVMGRAINFVLIDQQSGGITLKYTT
jgi:hypothetical protein